MNKAIFKGKILCMWILLFLIHYTKSLDEFKCYKCDSKTYEPCARSPPFFSDVKCDDKYGCITYIDKEGYTFRDCATENDSTKYENNLGENCKTPYCNNKLFPKNRLECNQCNGMLCENIYFPSAEVCQIYKLNEKCYTAIVNNTVYRGCTTDKDNKYNEAGSNVITCQENDCNKLKAQPFSCYNCTSDEIPGCKDDPASSSFCEISKKIPKCFTNSFEGDCYIYNNNGKIVRGCGNDKSKYLEETDYLTKCKEKNCNSKCIKDINCYECDSRKSATCSDDENLKGFNITCPGNTNKCYRCTDSEGKYTIRGCGENNNKNLLCNTCEMENFCIPEKPGIQCASCNSKDDASCVLSDGVNHPIKFCANPKDSCYTAIDQNGYTIRGCSSELSINCEKSNCEKCYTNNCNTLLFPLDRFQCHQCDRNYNCRNEQNSKQSTPCTIYKKNDSCYINQKDNGIERGCFSDNDQGTKDCIKNSKKCFICSSSGCNSLPLWRRPQQSCIQCENTDMKCKDNQTAASGKKCLNDIIFWKSESCFIYKSNDGKITRGCTIGSELCDDTNDPKCKYCTKSNCNEKIEFPCIRCGSKDSENCINNAKLLSPTECDTEIIKENAGCYISKNRGYISRGCLADLTIQTRQRCLANETNFCYSCFQPSCNIGSIPNSSNKILSSIFIFMLCSIYNFLLF